MDVFDTVYSFQSRPNHAWTERDRITFGTSTRAICNVYDSVSLKATMNDVWSGISDMTQLQGNLLLNTIQSNENMDYYTVLLAFRVPESFTASLDGTNTTYLPKNVQSINFKWFQTTFAFSTEFTVNPDYDRVKGSTFPFSYAYKVDGGLTGFDDIGFAVNIGLFNSLFLTNGAFSETKLKNYLADQNIFLFDFEFRELVAGLKPFISVCEYTAKNGDSWLVHAVDADLVMLNFFCIAALGREYSSTEWGENTPSVNITETELFFRGRGTVYYNPYSEQWNPSPSFLPNIDPFDVLSELTLSSSQLNQFWNTLLANRFLYISIAFMCVGIIFVALTRGD